MTMTEKQEAFIRRLLDERETGDWTARIVELIDGSEPLPASRASSIIDWLMEQPFKPTPHVAPEGTGVDLAGIPEGRYAVGDVLFRVDLPESGKWAGWVFVKDGSEYHGDVRFGSQRPGGTYFGKHADLLLAVVEDPKAAMQHYGRVTNHCAVCGRKLEDDLSVQRGIGPVCWEKVA